MPETIKVLVLGLLGAAGCVGAANAAGFGRADADTDILYEQSSFDLRAGATLVMPRRGYETINGAPATDPDFTRDHVIPSIAANVVLHDKARCAGTFVEVYGADVVYGPQKIMSDQRFVDGPGGLDPIPTANATESVELTSNEYGLTCAFGFQAGPGTAWIIGGGFLENFQYTEDTVFGTLDFDGGYEPGFRVGAAFSIEEIALRAQLLYRSSVSHSPGGTFSGYIPNPGFNPLAPSPTIPQFALPSGLYDTSGVGTTPQSVELSVQSGVAPGTLVFGSVKWTDWSVVDTLDYTIDPSGAALPSRNEYFWKDGWTVTAGVGRQITEMVAASASLTWDQGVSTTEDVLTDTWTLGGGVAVSGERASLQIGGAINYLTAGSVAMDPDPTDADPAGANSAATVGADWAFALGGSLTITW